VAVIAVTVDIIRIIIIIVNRDKLNIIFLRPFSNELKKVFSFQIKPFVATIPALVSFALYA
jgi:hypothetical protein